MSVLGANEFSAIGASSVFWALNSSGLPAGPTGALSAGSSAGMSRLKFVKSLDVTDPDPETVYSSGDNGVGPGFLLAANTGPTATLTTGARNQTFAAKSGGLKIGASGAREILGLLAACRTFPQMSLLINSPIKSIESASLNQQGYVVNALMNIQANTKGFTTMTERAVRDWVANLIIDQSSKMIWGEPWTTLLHGKTSFAGLEFTHDYEVHIKTVRGNGVIDSVALDEQLAVASADNIWIWTNTGTELDYTTDFTGDTTANEVNFDAPLVNNTYYQIAYGFISDC